MEVHNVGFIMKKRRKVKTLCLHRFNVIRQLENGELESVEISKRYSQITEFLHWAKTRCKAVKTLPSRPWFDLKNDLERVRRQIILTDHLSGALRHREVYERFETAFFLGIRFMGTRVEGAKVLFPLPDKDFDPSEFVIPFHALKVSGVEITIATPSGESPKAEPLVLRPEGVSFGELGASYDVRDLYQRIKEFPEYMNVISFDDIDPMKYDAIHLNGGHAPGMKSYLESEVLQRNIASFVKKDLPIGAICHGTLVLARSKGEDGKSIIRDRNVTTLPYFMEKFAVGLTSWKLGDYYQTYNQPCADEVTTLLDNPGLFQRGPLSGALGTLYDDTNTWVVIDRNIVTARFPGDAYCYSKKLLELIAQQLAK